MSMADDNRLRAQRPSEPIRRGAPAGDDRPSGDPLAELARLIGQTDPFADYGRRDGRETRERDARESMPRAAQPKAPPEADWRRTAAAMPPYDPPSEGIRRAPPARSEPRYEDVPFPSHDPYQMAADERLDPRYQERPSHHRQEPHRESHQQESYRQEPHRQEPQFADEPSYPQQDERMFAAPVRGQRSQPAYLEDGAPMGAEDEDAYDDPPRARRRGGLLTAVTLIGCAMIGTAGAYGYRTYYVTPNAGKVPPVITAETSPSKVVSAAEGPSGKFIQDRVRDPVQNERLVSREEPPADIWPSAPPRVVLPSPLPRSQTQPALPPAAPPSASASAQPSAPGGASDTKRVRTVTIRPDGTDAPGRPGNPQAAVTPPAPRASPPPRNTGPTSLDPQDFSSAPAPREPAPRERAAATPPPSTTQSVQPPAPRQAAVPSEGPSGGYAVQLSSQRSETEAQASYRALQAKFPDQLSGRSAMVKRVDLGSKGIYYRALVGPFTSSDDATQFCSELKAAGGQCFIQRN